MEPNPGVIEQFASVVEQLWRQFAGGENARLRDTGVVHAVGPVRLLGELVVPGARCHTGVAGGELGAITPTRDAVTCRTCLEMARLRGEAPGPDGALQLVLFDLPDERSR
ncbi:hypothetical protein AB0M43_10055 [Longispora sp. NPDC051575]|uniref:hypothetical protein n=1 Tax=Longispora sp. NPDC051575 TaxID=3154943 RepID=UPI0034279924